MILSIQNKIVKQIFKLKTKKERDKTGLIIIEGERFISQVPANIEIQYYIFSESFSKKTDVLNIYNKAHFYVVSDDIFKKISETDTPQGIIAICKINKNSLENLKIDENSIFLILDRIMDPGNLGTIIRSADALGISAIFLSNGCVDLYNSKVLRSTMGSVFNIPIFTNCDIPKIITNLKKQNFKIVCTHLKGAKNVFEVSFLKKIAIIIGNEANGVLDEYINLADEIVKIPMVGNAESINASNATSIIFYEALRQRLN